MKMEDIHAKSQDEIKDLIGSLKRELFNLRFQQAASETFNTGRFSEVRRDIARARTAMTQKINGQPVVPAKKAGKASTKKTKAA
ncbi:MAG: 50S ribosomal protein L29 [Rickettsiales bacterium]|nr:50S ribosomal protein L29 [Rickettsiales bacterium]